MNGGKNVTKNYKIWRAKKKDLSLGMSVIKRPQK
jgi:hypothetical protein